MARLSDRVAGGDLTVRVPNIHRGDEVGVLYASLCRMVENLRELLGQTQEGISMMGSSASEILATTTQIASGGGGDGHGGQRNNGDGGRSQADRQIVQPEG
jgi:methyl-accepting chemotaxis protein